MDSPCLPPGSVTTPGADRALFDGQDLAVRVRRQRAYGGPPDAARRNPRNAGGLHGQARRLQRGRLEAKTGRGPPPQRRARGRPNPAGPEAVRRRLAAGATARVGRSPLWTPISSLGRSSAPEGRWVSGSEERRVGEEGRAR